MLNLKKFHNKTFNYNFTLLGQEVSLTLSPQLANFKISSVLHVRCLLNGVLCEAYLTKSIVKKICSFILDSSIYNNFSYDEFFSRVCVDYINNRPLA